MGGRTSVTDRVEAALAAIEAAGPEAQRTFTKLYPDEARAAAAAADQRRAFGHTLGPLDGVIVSIKDLLDVRGEPTAAGSIISRTAAPAVEDAPVVQRLRAAGAVIIGRTTMSEYAYSGLGLNPHTGTPGCVADPTRAPGGSSSGAGVSAGHGWVDVAIGSDTGGSIRIPSAFNGLVGYKPSQGRVPTEGAFPLSFSLDTIGPLTRSVALAHATDAVLAGLAPSRLEALPVAGLRIGVMRGFLFAELDDVVGPAIEAGLARLAAAGARVVDVDLEAVTTLPGQIQSNGTIAAAEAAYIHRDTLDTRASDFDARVLARIRRGTEIPASVYVGMQRRREEAKRLADAAVADFDAVVAPTVPMVAPPIAPLEADVDLFNRVNLLALRNPSTFNFLDLPAASLPIELGQPLPVGLMVVGRRGRDAELFRVLAALEPLLAPAPRTKVV
jgi:aspartyl-tRNA(Asn)/glutamyl-tRNA(Gln) amidotransferase subunit A